MQPIQFFAPTVRVGGTARILEDQAGKAVFDTNANGQADSGDSYVLARNSVEGGCGQVPVGYANLQAHVGSLGRATSREVAESMTRYEWAGTAVQVTDVVPQHEQPGQVGTIFHFETPQPYAEFIVRG